MQAKAFFTRISEDEAKSISTQVSMGVLAETNQAVRRVQAELQKNLPQEHLEEVYAEAEKTLRARGIKMSFARNKA